VATRLVPVAWFNRKSHDDEEPEADPRVSSSPFDTADNDGDEELPLRPVARRLGAEEAERIARGLEQLDAAGVDLDDLVSLGAAYDDAFDKWESGQVEEGHERIVERFAIGIGEHLHRHTDLSWQVVTDAFGTDLAVAGGGRGDFVVVPSNLVAARWMKRETGWVPGVVGHLVVRRSRR
jgi:Domain of unknown function (DUF3806)